jgi:hypothetical protein
VDAYARPGGESSQLDNTHSRAVKVPEVMPTSATERQQQLATLKQVRPPCPLSRVSYSSAGEMNEHLCGGNGDAKVANREIRVWHFVIEKAIE